MSDNFENTGNSGAPAQGDSSKSIMYYVKELIWDYKWWYVATVLLCIAAAFFYLYKTPATYTRTAKVIISEDAQDAAMRNMTAAFSSINPYGGSASENVNNEIEAISSPDLMEQVVLRLGLETRYTELQSFREVEMYRNTPFTVTRTGDNPASSFSFTAAINEDSTFTLDDFRIGGKEIKGEVKGRPGDTLSTPVGGILVSPTMYFGQWDDDVRVNWTNAKSAGKAYNGSLNVSLSGKQSSVVVLTQTDMFPARAESILSALIDVYNELWVHDRNRSARNTSEFINERLIVIEAELGGIEESLREYKEENRLTDLQSASETYLSESSEYATRSFEVNNQLAIANYIKEYLNDPSHRMALIPANSGISSANVEAQIAEYNNMLLRRERLLTTSSEQNPVVTDLTYSMESIRETILRSIENLIATLELQADKIAAQEEQIMSKIASSSGQELQLLSFERQQKVKESLYIYLLQKREENEIASLVNVGNTRLIMEPNGPSAPIAPNRNLILLVALALGCALPFAVIFVIKSADTTVKGKPDLSSIDIPFLAEIPMVNTGHKSRWERLTMSEKYDNSNRKIIISASNRDYINEAFRVLRTNLDLMLGKKDGCRTIMGTSLNPDAGKTFIMMNTAASMAVKGAKVLLIDLDMRKATLSKSLGDWRKGISSWLNGDADDYRPLIKNISDNLAVLPVGTVPPNPSELLLSDRFERLMTECRNEYKYIFIDCPPMDLVADTSIIAQYAEMTMFVMRSGVFDKRALPIIADKYREGTLKRMAIVLNGVALRNMRYGYGYGYGKYGYYGDSGH
ncbi:MAG TPA: polysaccharide biosynthesis tyrosine autokinase [Candidatus Coprenecus stercoripullorum]|nr:polysaccharide biosynthesis tyrosine autokinase [Candidatus Coprenecus stercoripullorum]